MATTPRLELSKVFDDFIETYESLRSVSKNKQEALLDRDMEELESLTEEQSVLVQQLEAIEERKQELAKQHLENGASVDGLTLSRLQEAVSAPQDEMLSEKRLRLKQLIRDVQRFTRENQRLLETRMDFFEELFEELSKGQSGETYDSDSTKDAATADEAVIFDEAI